MAEDVLWGDLGGEVSPSLLCTFLSPSKGCGEPGLGVCLLAELMDLCVHGHGWKWLREMGPRQVRYLVGWDRTKLDSAASAMCPGKAGVRRRSCTVVMLGHSEGSCGRVGALRAQQWVLRTCWGLSLLSWIHLTPVCTSFGCSSWVAPNSFLIFRQLKKISHVAGVNAGL